MRSGLPVLASRVFGVLLGFVTAPIIAHSLGPDGRGLTAAAMATLGLLPIVLGLGTPLVIRRRASSTEMLGRAIRSARIIALVSIVPAVLLGALAATFLLPGLTPADTGVFLAASASVPFAVLWICDANVLVGQRRMMAFAIVGTVAPVAYFGFIVVGALTSGLSVGFVIGANGASTILTFLITSALVRVPVKGAIESPVALLREGVSFSGSQIAEAASYRLDQAISIPIIGAAGAGYYAVAATIGLIPYSLGQAIGAASYAKMAEVELTELERTVRVALVVRSSMVLGTGSSLSLAALCPLLVPLLFGSDFLPAVIPAVIATFGSAFVVVAYSAGSALTAYGRGWWLTLGQTSGLGLGVVMLLLLGPLLGAIGAALASALGYALTMTIAVYALKLPRRSLLIRRTDFRDSIRLVVFGHVP